MTQAQQVTHLLGTPSIRANDSSTTYEWVVESTTLDNMAPSLRRQLKELGCTMCNVDSSREPYYYVCVRYTEV